MADPSDAGREATRAWMTWNMPDEQLCDGVMAVVDRLGYEHDDLSRK